MKNEAIENKPILTLTNVSKNFGGVVAAKDINFELFPREVFGLIGPNGAGKTTLINLITGVNKVDKGSIKLDGQDITSKPNYYRARVGITRTFQHPHLLKRCDVETNLLLGVDLANKKAPRQDEESARYLAMLLESAGLDLNMKFSIDKLTYGQQKLLEIVRALLTRPRVILLDEPAAGLNQREMEKISTLIGVAIANNAAVLIIEHRMDLVMSICHRVAVLNFGNQIASGTPQEIQCNPIVIEAYLGRRHHAGN